METDENLPENVKEALRRIKQEKENSSGELNLSNLGLTSDQLEYVIAKIKESLPDLQYLNLDCNNLSEIPENISAIDYLSGLDLNDNNLSHLPDILLNFPMLKSLGLANNHFTEIPEALQIYDNELEYLYLQNNNISQLPEDLSRLSIINQVDLSGNHLTELPEDIAQFVIIGSELDLSNNPLSEETINFLNTTTSSGESNIAYNMAAHDVTSDYQEVLAKIYGEEKEAIVKKMEALDPSWSFLNGNYLAESAQEELFKIESGESEGSKIRNAKKIVEENTLSAKNVLISLLKKIPLNKPHAYEVFFEGAKYHIDTILDETISKADKKSALYQMAKALGDCGTPVKDTLIQGYIKKHRNSTSLPKGYDSLIAREAVESAISSQLLNKEIDGRKILRKNEEIEQVQGLTNAIFMKYGATAVANKCKMVFSGDQRPDTLPSKTAYPTFAFNQVSPELAKEFAKLCCETNENGTLLQDEEGNYLFSPKKLRGMVEKYKKERLGIISQRESAINDYARAIEKILKDTELLSEHFDKSEVEPFLEPKKLEDELRKMLLEVSDNEVWNTAATYLEQQKTVITKVVESIEKSCSATAQPMLAMVEPIDGNKKSSLRRPPLRYDSDEDKKPAAKKQKSNTIN